MKLIRPDMAMKDAYLAFEKDWASAGEDITPYSARLLGLSYEEWLSRAYEIETKAPDDFVTAHTFFLADDKSGLCVLGAINIRHYLNEYLLNYGGHIGYGIRPSERRKGYAVKMLEMALPLAKELGIEKALITCDKENIASAKTIIKNGGILENEVPQDGKIVQRYWIEL